MNRQRHASHRCVAAALGLLLGVPAIAAGQVMKEPNSALDALVFPATRLQPPARIEPLVQVESAIAPAVAAEWSSFVAEVAGEWSAGVDPRTGTIGLVEGSGLPWIPGFGNRLSLGSVSAPLSATGEVGLETMESLARRFLAQHGALLGVDPAELRLNPERSGQAAVHLWYVEFDLYRDGIRVDDARVVFRVNNGNLVQFGTENHPPRSAVVPAARFDRDAAFAVLRDYVGNFDPIWDLLVDAGTMHLVTAAPSPESMYGEIGLGDGVELVRFWEFRFRREGEGATWRGRVDATTGELLEFVDANEYASVTGGVRNGGNLPPDTVLPMPFANLSSGGFTNSAGLYTWPGIPVTSTLNGQYVRISDNCGAISQTSNGVGDILFGSSPQAATDCTTPGSGGAGNTKSARTQFYWLNRTKEQARGWVTRPWLTAQLTANVNINLTCNAFWNGSTVNFYRSGGGCGNTGELPGVSLHEYGHGFDTNDGNGSSPDNGTGETYGDFTAALATHESCIGGGFLGGNCGSYGNACTSCTGVRDIDYALHVSGAPATVNGFTRTNCPTSGTGYVGPCNREGHCESYVSSQALWDFPNRDLPSPGSGAAWSTTERLWYLSRSTATGAFSCTTGGTWTSNGCAAGSLWKTMRLADDDDGNLNNGTPHSCYLYAAFNRHGIACTTDPAANTCFTGCTPPATPSISLSAGNNQVTVSWTPVGGQVYDLYRNEAGCSAGFVKIANDLVASPYVDTSVANGLTYYYQLITHPTGNEACGSIPSACNSATPTPCPAIAAPLGVAASATANNQITVSWNDSATGSVVSYDILRSTTSGGPYTVVANVPDTGGPYSYPDNTVSGGLTYYYVVRAVAPGGCLSPNSLQVQATATGECTLPPNFAGLTSVGNLGGGQGCGLRLQWNAATSQCGGAVTYSIHRATSSGFTPDGTNRIASCVSGTAFDDTTMPLDTNVFYVVRAEDSNSTGTGACNNGNVDTNGAQQSGVVSSSALSGTIYSHDFESATGAPLYDWADISFGGANLTWRGRQNCSGNIFRFGGTTCSGAPASSDYGSGTFRAREPGNGAGIVIAAGSTNVQLSFQHRWQFESSGGNFYDGATLAVSLDGTNYSAVPGSAIVSGTGYSGAIASTTCTTGSSGGLPAWGGTSSGYASNTMQSSTVDLDAVCDLITGGSGGCSGQTVHIAWTAISDCSVVADGWFIDNVAITRDPIAACTAAPQPVQFLTATGKNQQVSVEWKEPASGPLAGTRLRSSTAAPPADPTAGTLLVNEPGATNEKELFAHATGGGSNGTVQYYSAFGDSGAGFSARRTVSGLPQATAGNWKWNFSTPASALAPPIQGRGLGIFLPSNDRSFYALGTGAGAGGGLWKSGFSPAAMNAPAQSSPIVMLAAETGLLHDAAFVGSQDGYVYCFNAATGAGCSGWPAGGRSVASFGIVQAQPMFDPTTKRVLFGSRNAVGANGFHALDVLTGATAWSFTNSVPQGGNGDAMGIVSGPALILGSQVVFTSRTRAGGSAHTVWSLNFTAATVSFGWARDLGDIDAAPTLDFTSNRVLVGNNAGQVRALQPATGADVWGAPRNLGDGAVKGFIYFHPGLSRFYLTTDTTVWAIPADGSTGSDWSLAGLFSPTRPLLHFGTNRTYVGACDTALCTAGRVIELDGTNAWATPKTLDLAGVGGLGPVTIDRSQSPALLHAGSRSGRAVAVELPLP
ncbi:MAG: hypothetical protein AB7G12_05840 [Thermoanaerobaculia bacterium]